MAWWRSIFAGKAPADPSGPTASEVNRLRDQYARLADDDLRAAVRAAETLEAVIAASAVVAERVLGQRMFDVQIQGALALACGQIVEMQTGEGKTLAAVPAA